MNHTEIRSPKTLSRMLATFLVSIGLLFFTAVPRAHAEGNDDACRHRIEHADHRLHDAIDHHGPTSPEAERARHELHEARERCWNENHKWWDEDQHRWHDQQDWDDHDHDHDHDH